MMSNGNQDFLPAVTTASLADHLGLSRWTVSRVLNGHAGVRPETVERVHAAMEELGYHPSPIARGLRGVKTGMLGVCFLELETPVLVRKSVALQEILRQRGYQAIIELTGGRLELEEQTILSFQALKVDGIFLVGSSLEPESPEINRLAASGIPVVAIDPVGSLPFPRVSVNRARAYQLLAEHLLDLDPEATIGVLGIHKDVIYGKERLKGLREAARKRERDFETLYQFHYDPERRDLFYEYGYDLCAELVKGGDLPRSLLCLNDQIALGAIRCLLESGISIPGRVRVSGFDNLHISRYCYPALTTIGQRVDNLMTEAANKLLRWIDEGEPPSNRVKSISPRLIVRESTVGFST